MPDFSLETEHGGRVAGVDEAGCGPLAGPVVAAAVVFGSGVPADLALVIDDSKVLKAARREDIVRRLPSVPGIEIGIGAASVAEILTLNILRAAQLAMRRAVGRLPAPPALALVDGNRVPDFGGVPVRTLVGGDAISLSIAAASILAKVTRDRIMKRLDQRWPGYGWAGNAGYGTAAHRTAITVQGCTPHHRRGFGTVRKQLALILTQGDPA
ncbi:ribonuclease HII [Acetobacter oeni]|uniref:Ribonuclease HII n=1 Tax=Acetobacter oeni TaxID=304077 RepID=A0A511XMW7_9PROT|nr:ribonuclease HII [Acetobacter oeni]MBB3881502.1 ribonuclease HII [Acetobacter oeni]NHO18366.1 ribonuclease HII [Acetobacter oeni]GBR10811.1 ribonuclease HII [Acetobacter oeni LMG 21952]GEN64288.1 ribonuclease HII [Acetobacter oeni]